MQGGGENGFNVGCGDPGPLSDRLDGSAELVEGESDLGQELRGTETFGEIAEGSAGVGAERIVEGLTGLGSGAQMVADHVWRQDGVHGAVFEVEHATQNMGGLVE